jgi:nitrite reductase/ring-hydroxylating ferredoxin subunit
MVDHNDDAKSGTACLAPRRCFLKLVGAGSLASVMGGCGASDSAEPEAFGDVPAGSAQSLTLGSLQAVPGAPAIIGRDSGGVYAMTATCTHEGCDMIQDGSISNSGVSCNCHGSHFDAVGNRVSGPANAPLTHFAVEIDATSGEITVRGGTKVDASTRTPVPAIST